MKKYGLLNDIIKKLKQNYSKSLAFPSRSAYRPFIYPTVLLSSVTVPLYTVHPKPKSHQDLTTQFMAILDAIGPRLL